MKKRVLVAGLSHETHTFVQGVTALADYRIRRGNQLFEADGDGSVLDGALTVARERGWEVLPVIEMDTMPAGTVADEVLETFWTAFQEAVERERAGGIDGLYLIMHGAMVCRSFPDVEGEILRRIRRWEGGHGSLLRDVPICGVLDLHGNYTEAMARYSSGLIAYRENPHTDARQAAMDGARLLDRLMQTGERPVTVYAHPPLVWPPTGTGTADEPMHSLEAKARQIERDNPDILAVNIFGGFSFADIPETGVAFSAVTVGDPQKARDLLRELSALTLSLKEKGCPVGLSIEEAMEQLAQHQEGPIILVEPSDNIGGGAPGDLTHVLQALVESGAPNAGVILNDPEAVLALWNLSPGARKRLPLGGKSGEIGAEPITLDVEFVSKSDGRFTLEDRHSHAAVWGAQVEMGPCAVVRHEGIVILLTSRKTPPFDLGQWRSQGIDPERLFAINVKAAVAHRQAYNKIAKASYTLDTPGPCAENLKRLPYKHIRRPIYPLDEIESEW